MGAEQSQQRSAADGRAIFEGDIKVLPSGSRTRPISAHTPLTSGTPTGAGTGTGTGTGSTKRRNVLRQTYSASGSSNSRQHTATGYPTTSHSHNGAAAAATDTASPTTLPDVRAPSPPLSVCSDLPVYVSYTDRPIGDSPKIRSKPHSALQSSSSSSSRVAARKSHPTGAKPKRPQSTAASHSIVIVKPGARDNEFDVDPDLARLRSIPQFLPVLRESIASATYTRDPEILERLHAQHLLSICSRMQTHLNLCATQVASEQNHLCERTKVVSNSITTLFASFVDMQKTYAAYAEQFAKIRSVSQQLSRCNSLLNENIASLEAINDFLDPEDRLEPFVWRTDDNKLRGEAEGAVGGGSGSGRITRF